MKQYTIQELKTPGTLIHDGNYHVKSFNEGDRYWRDSDYRPFAFKDLRTVAFHDNFQGEKNVIQVYAPGCLYNWYVPLSEFQRLGLVKEETLPDEYAVYAETVEQAIELASFQYKLFGSNNPAYSDRTYRFSPLKRDDRHGFSTDRSYYSNKGIKVFSYQEWKQLINNNNSNMEKKITGYKLKKDLPDLKAGVIFTKDTNGGWEYEADPVQYWYSDRNVQNTEWFEPVYEEDIKIGDIVKCKPDAQHKVAAGYVPGLVFKVTKIDNVYSGIVVFGGKDGAGVFGVDLVKATHEEIRQYEQSQKVVIGSYMLEKRSSGEYKFGCKLFKKEDILLIRRLVTDSEIRANITIQGTKITEELLDKILKL